MSGYGNHNPDDGRAEVIQRIFRGEMTMGEAAIVLGVTERHSYRILRKEDGVLIASGWTKHACVDKKGEVPKIPPSLEAVLKAAVSPASKEKSP